MHLKSWRRVSPWGYLLLLLTAHLLSLSLATLQELLGWYLITFVSNFDKVMKYSVKSDGMLVYGQQRLVIKHVIVKQANLNDLFVLCCWTPTLKIFKFKPRSLWGTVKFSWIRTIGRLNTHSTCHLARFVVSTKRLGCVDEGQLS